MGVAALPVIAGVALSAGMGAAMGAVGAAINGGDVLEAATDGFVDGFMWGGIFAWAGAATNAATSGNLLNGAKPSITNSTSLGTGYDTFAAFKNAQGSAGQGKEWHHIVEQSQITKSGFSPQQIHNTNNMIAIDAKIHRQISGYYNRLYGSTGMSVRTWLVGKSFDEQYKFGLEVLRIFGVL